MRHKKIRGLGLWMGAVVLAGSVYAGTYYVSPDFTSTDWAAAANITTPCTISTAFAQAQAGDTVLFRGGTYLVSSRNHGNWLNGYYNPAHSGTPESPVTFMAYPGETPLLDGQSGGSADVDGHGYRHFATLLGVSDAHNGNGYKEYIIYDGFTFQADGGVSEARVSLCRGDNGYTGQRGRGVIIRNCTFNGGSVIHPPHAEGGTGDNHEGLFISQMTGLVVSNCRFKNYLHAQNNHNTSAIKTYHCDNLSVENCEFYNNTIAVFYKSNTDFSRIHANFIIGGNKGILSGGTGWWRDPNDRTKGYHFNQCENLTISHNIITGQARGSVEIINQDGTNSDNLVVLNNTFHSGAVPSASVNLGSGVGQVFYNNILYGIRTDGDLGLMRWYCGNNDPQDIADGKPEVKLEIEAMDHNQFGDFQSNFLIRIKRPNLSAQNYSTLAAWQTSQQLTQSRNPGVGSLVSNPLFVNASGTMAQVSDFALQAGSPCKGAGRGGVDMGADVSRVGVPGNLPPMLAPVGNRSVPAGVPLQFAVEASDADGDELQYSATGNP